MSVYSFDKSLLERINEIKLILDGETGNRIRDQWKEFLEVSLEPAGYTAIWRISKASCEELDIKYPCEVYGFVNDTSFDELLVLFSVESVQNDNIHLPEICQVPFDDLYPTIEQENSALNVDLTADCLDRFRFFFNYICLPWNYNDLDFVGKHLLPRMKLFFDLKTKQIGKGLSSHIRGIIAEAKYIHSKRENLQSSLDDSCEDIDISHGESKDKAKKLLQLHFRMNTIKHEIEILENPEMREIYEELQFPHHQHGKDGIDDRKVFAVAVAGTLSERQQVNEELKHKVADDTVIHSLSLHDAIAASAASSEIFIPAGEHSISFLEYLNGDVLLCGLTNIDMDNTSIDQLHRYAKITAAEPGSMLFAIDGCLRMENLVIDCQEVKTGLLVKGGEVIVKNCAFLGSKESSVSEAFAISGASKVTIENCVISEFATGITCEQSTQVNIRNSTIKGCNIAIQLLDDEVSMSMEKSSILNSDEIGILKYSTMPGDVESKALDWNDSSGVQS